MLAPFTPHLCEEIWEQAGGDGFIAFADWPKVEEKFTRPESEELESIIQNSIEDIQKISKVTGITPKKIHFYTADGWKWKIYLRAMELAKADKLDIGTLIRYSFKDDEMKARSRQVPNFARIVVDEVMRMPKDKLIHRLSLGQINEVSLLQDAKDFLEGEFDAGVIVYMESDPWLEDPAKRANRAKPYKPAIYVE
jgi:leucyl-tRNA synthetase